MKTFTDICWGIGIGILLMSIIIMTGCNSEGRSSRPTPPEQGSVAIDNLPPIITVDETDAQTVSVGIGGQGGATNDLGPSDNGDGGTDNSGLSDNSSGGAVGSTCAGGVGGAPDNSGSGGNANDVSGTGGGGAGGGTGGNGSGVGGAVATGTGGNQEVTTGGTGGSADSSMQASTGGTGGTIGGTDAQVGNSTRGSGGTTGTGANGGGVDGSASQDASAADTTVPQRNCVLTWGWYATHLDWPAHALILGFRWYSESELRAILAMNVQGGNGLVALAHQLIAAKLNKAAGAYYLSIEQDIEQADALIGSLVIPPVGTGYLSPASTSALMMALTEYNQGGLYPEHCE